MARTRQHIDKNMAGEKGGGRKGEKRMKKAWFAIGKTAGKRLKQVGNQWGQGEKASKVTVLAT